MNVFPYTCTKHPQVYPTKCCSLFFLSILLLSVCNLSHFLREDSLEDKYVPPLCVLFKPPYSSGQKH